MTIKAIETIYNSYKFRSRLEARWAVFFDTIGIKYVYESEGYEIDKIRYLPDFWLPNNECWIEIKPIDPVQADIQKAGMLAAHSGRYVNIFAGDIKQGAINFIAYHTALPEHMQIGRYVDRAFVERDDFLLRMIIHQYPKLYWKGVIDKAALLFKDKFLSSYYPSMQSEMYYEKRNNMISICKKCNGLIFGSRGGTYFQDNVLACENCNCKKCTYKYYDTIPDFIGYCNKCNDNLVDNDLLNRAYLAARQARFEHGEKP